MYTNFIVQREHLYHHIEKEKRYKPEKEIISINNAMFLPVSWFQVIGFLQSPPSASCDPSRERWSDRLIWVKNLIWWNILIENNKTKQKNFAPYFQALDKYENKSVWDRSIWESHRIAEINMIVVIHMGMFLLSEKHIRCAFCQRTKRQFRTTD